MTSTNPPFKNRVSQLLSQGCEIWSDPPNRPTEPHRMLPGGMTIRAFRCFGPNPKSDLLDPFPATNIKILKLGDTHVVTEEKEEN